MATSTSAKGTDEFFIHAMAEVMKQSNRSMAESHSYRRLRVFSGITPTPMGEEQVEYWIEQATMMVEGSDCPEKEKRRRIIESLRGPALEIVRSLRFSNPEVDSAKYIFLQLIGLLDLQKLEKICILHIVSFNKNLERCCLTTYRGLNLF